jgi:haloacetate dehalogenase
MSAPRLAGFEPRTIELDDGPLHARVGGAGPPLLLLHGFPQTHVMWHGAAPLLAERFTVVAADLPGYGDSRRPEPTADHAPHSKRAMAAELVAAMGALGHERFAVAGHDRGGRVAYRMALDHPERVARAAVLDIVPTADVWADFDAQAGLVYWHWFFLAQPYPLPERLILGDPEAFLTAFGGSLGLGGEPDRYPEAVMAEYRRRLGEPDAVRAMCEDYRAAATLDREQDEADRGRRRIACPLLALWGSRGFVGARFDVIEVWRAWADDVSGCAVDASHFLAEDRPEEVAAELAAFFAG